MLRELFFYLCTACCIIMIAVATDTTISHSLCRWYRLLFNLSFLDVYDNTQEKCKKVKQPMQIQKIKKQGQAKVI
jgi:uncharacterized membrane protein